MPRLFADISPLREHRAFRRLWLGQVVSGLGSQLTIVGIAYQTYRLTGSSFMVGLVSLVQLAPLLVGSLWGGSIVDAHDRRRVLLVTQVALAATSLGLAVNAALPHPVLWPIFLCTAASAGFQGVDMPARRAALPMIVPHDDLPAAIALQQVLFQLTAVVGPALAGLLIATTSLSFVYGADVASFGAGFTAVVLLPALVPAGGGTPAGWRSVAEGMRYLRGQRLLASTFWIDINAMVFGMPRALFPALGTQFFGGGAGTVGLLYAAPAAGALIGALLTGWVSAVRRQGRAVVIAVIVWGAAIAVFGLIPILWVGLVLLAVAGAADVVSAVFRNAILQMTVPDHLQGRLNGVFTAVVTGGPRLGDAEAGAVAAIAGPQVSVVSGGLACIAGVGLIVWKVPELWRHDVRATSRAVQHEREAVMDAVIELSESEPG
ncbi:MAG TPA: MFS transporter [Acidimicrobiales bacterium]|nr:MFS transporter [Acidimicrobiales bacterium]